MILQQWLTKETKRKGIGILTPKQILQRLPKALPQVKTGYISGNKSFY